jgi:hypothetical protein
VDEINRLRAVQEKQALQQLPAAEEGADAFPGFKPIPAQVNITAEEIEAESRRIVNVAVPIPGDVAKPPKRRGGRPRKEPKQ